MADFFTWVGSDDGCIKIRGQWIRAKSLCHERGQDPDRLVQAIESGEMLE